MKSDFIDVSDIAKPYDIAKQVELSSAVYDVCVSYTHRDDGLPCEACELFRLRQLLFVTAAAFRALKATRKPELTYRHICEEKKTQKMIEKELILKISTTGNPIQSVASIQFVSTPLKQGSLSNLI
jgi:hypothetical protein